MKMNKPPYSSTFWYIFSPIGWVYQIKLCTLISIVAQIVVILTGKMAKKGSKLTKKRVCFTKMAKTCVKNRIILLNMVWDYGTGTSFTGTTGTNFIRIHIDMK